MKKVIGFALLIFATFCIVPLTIINRKNVEEKYGDTNTYWLHTARNIDIWGNVEFKATWDKELITAIIINGNEVVYPYKFGVQGETISEALQRNYELGTLTKKGLRLYRTIELIDKRHFEPFKIQTTVLKIIKTEVVFQQKNKYYERTRTL